MRFTPDAKSAHDDQKPLQADMATMICTGCDYATIVEYRHDKAIRNGKTTNIPD